MAQPASRAKYEQTSEPISPDEPVTNNFFIFAFPNDFGQSSAAPVEPLRAESARAVRGSYLAAITLVVGYSSMNLNCNIGSQTDAKQES
jgi:hypothetical protein